MTRILEACDQYPGNRDRIKAFVLVMRYSGLRIGDTIRLSRDQVQTGRIRLYTAKTGQPVYVPIPPTVENALAMMGGGTRYFWTGMNMRSAVANWSRYLASVFEIAGVEGGRSHRFRDTAACIAISGKRRTSGMRFRYVKQSRWAAWKTASSDPTTRSRQATLAFFSKYTAPLWGGRSRQ